LEEGRTAIDDVIALDITVIAMTPAHCRAAFSWADRLGQSKAYDGFYLALADELAATFYTTDQRLVNSAQQKGISWVTWIGDSNQ
jgi:predicted nucleic acid-binding protein